MSQAYTVVIPALNEEEGLGAVIDRIKALPGSPEIVIVDDGSTDKTAEIARAKGCTVVSHPMPGGYGRSLKDGIAKATNDTIVITDADGTYPIEDIPRLITLFEKGYDMVVGARHGKHYRGALLKMPARILLKWLVEFTTGRFIPDINSGFRVFRKSDIAEFQGDLCNGFSFTTTITLIYMLSGKFVEYMPIEYAARTGKSKVRIIRDSLRTLQYITEVILAYNPLKLFVLMSAALAILSVIAFVLGITMVLDWLMVLGIFGAVASVLVFAIGLHAVSCRHKQR